MLDSIFVIIPLISLIAFFLKGITGTGSSTVVIALSSFFIDPKLSVVLASFINIFGGFSMLKIDPVELKKSYWAPIALVMIIGSILGAMTLKYIPGDVFKLILGIAFLLAALWFLLKSVRPKNDDVIPQKASLMDGTVGLFAGFCGGFIGINAPPLILHFSRALSKRYLRRLLVIIFIPAAIAQTATFAYNGLLSKDMFILGLLMLPTMAIGIYWGNKSFAKISEKNFRRILAIFLIIVSIRLIIKSFI